MLKEMLKEMLLLVEPNIYSISEQTGLDSGIVR